MTDAQDSAAPFAPGAERALDASNRGYRLLVKMGWRSGCGLGRQEQGVVEPVKMKENLVCLGLGKAEEYDQVTQLATSERRKLDVEVQETAAQAAEREARGARQEQLKAEVKSMQAAFYCADCRKQYATVTEMDNHLSSYDHHHTKRLRELQQQKRRVGSEQQQSAKRRKEQQQEELLLQRRIAAQTKAATVKEPVPLPPAVATAIAAKGDAEKQANQTGTAKVGFNFGGGMKMGLKKPAKKPLAVPSAFTNPFSQ
ncbi:G patch domain-containing protein 8 [Phytophthora cinnamomi]|uniref:G patch domain-containing protein 8 n=1 Tax=Phytophthora cinnamomi TaxID=4785 RepID=UPI00355A6447|nr:G patch domain-containing protein 8 [Phytophthora cinnamomi]